LAPDRGPGAVPSARGVPCDAFGGSGSSSSGVWLDRWCWMGDGQPMASVSISSLCFHAPDLYRCAPIHCNDLIPKEEAIPSPWHPARSVKQDLARGRPRRIPACRIEREGWSRRTSAQEEKVRATFHISAELLSDLRRGGRGRKTLSKALPRAEAGVRSDTLQMIRVFRSPRSRNAGQEPSSRSFDPPAVLVSPTFIGWGSETPRIRSSVSSRQPVRQPDGSSPAQPTRAAAVLQPR
jgi:hypothetical protein